MPCTTEKLFRNAFVMEKAEHLKQRKSVFSGLIRHLLDHASGHFPGGVHCVSIILSTLYDFLIQKFFAALRVKSAVFLHFTITLSDHRSGLGDRERQMS